MPANVDVKCWLHVHGFSPEMAEIPVVVYESFARLGKVYVPSLPLIVNSNLL